MVKAFDAYAKEWEENAQKDAYWAVLTSEEESWNKEAFFKTGDLEIGVLWDFIQRSHLPISKSGKALDFGCGTGRLSRALSRLFPEVVGVDISASMIEEARAACSDSKGITFVHNACPDLSAFPSNEFDFIYSNIVFQHINPREQLSYLKEFSRLLKQQGWAVVQIPSKRVYKNVSGRIKGLLGRIMPFYLKQWIIKVLLKNKSRAVQEFTFEMNPIKEAKVRRKAEAYGLEVVQVGYTNSTDSEYGGRLSFMTKEEALAKPGYLSLMYFFRKRP